MAENDEKKQEEKIQRLRREIETKIESARKELRDVLNKCPDDSMWHDWKKELDDILNKLLEIKIGIPPVVPGSKRSPWISKK